MSLRKCSYKPCGERFQKAAMFIHGTLAFCSENHRITYAIDAGKKLRIKKERGESVRRKREHYKDDLPHQKEETRKVFNEMIRLLDKGQPCISCGKAVCGQRMEAGHFKSVGSHPELRFDPRNCYLQGSGCNSATSSRRRNNLTVSKEYEQRLIEKMGQELVDWLNGPHPPAKYTCSQLQEMRAVFAAERTRLKKGLPPSRNWRAL
jgi:hypothetical protein